jgi:hypothetical protein
MKYLSIVSALIVSLIFATTVIFFTASGGFAASAGSKSKHHNSVASQHIRFIEYRKVD